MSVLRTLALTVFMVTTATLAQAQSSGATAGAIAGTVKDAQGALLAGATVRALHLATNLERTVNTDESGAYRIVQLPPGKYRLSVQAAGFSPATDTLTLTIGTTALAEFVLPVGADSEVIEVRADRIIDTGRTESSTNIDERRINNLPINRRNFLDFSLTSARVVVSRIPASGIAASSGISVNGQSERLNNITIDGLDNNDVSSGTVRTTFSQDAVQEFQIVSDNYSAEFGRAIGGVINIVTRGGSNDNHGTIFFFYRGDETSARDSFAAFKPPYAQYQFGASQGGPIKKDRLFYFTAVERLSIKQNNVVTIRDETIAAIKRRGFALNNGPVPFSVGTTTVLARLDGRLSPNDTIWLRYNGGFVYNGAFEPFGGLVGASRGGIQRLGDNALAFNNTYINAGLNLVNETRFQFNSRDLQLLPNGSGPAVTIFAPEGNVQFGRNTLLPNPRVQRDFQIINNTSLTRGRNQIKFGVDYQYQYVPAGSSQLPPFAGGFAIFNALNFSELTGIPNLPVISGLQNFDPALRTPAQRAFLQLLTSILPARFPGFPSNVPLAEISLPLVFAQGFGDPNLELRGSILAFFFQDDIKLRPNLTVKAGLRYDYFGAVGLPDTRGNVSPRLAISYQPARLPRLNLRATYGLFYGSRIGGAAGVVQVINKFSLPVIPFPFSVLPFSLPGNSFPESAVKPAAAPFLPQLGRRDRFAAPFGNTYAVQTSAGGDYFLDENTAISLSYNFVRGIKILGIRNINPVVRPVVGNPLASLLTGRVMPDQGDLFLYESSSDSYYHSFTATFNRRFANRFGLLASYTYAKAIDNLSGQVRGEGAADAADDPLQPGLERGLSANDLRHRLVLSGIFELSYGKNRLLRGYQLSTIVSLNSGQPYNLLAGVDLNRNGDFPPSDRPAGLGRNTGLLPGFASVDLRVQRIFQISDQVRLQALAEIFNLFNRTNISDVDRVFPPDAQGNFQLPPQQDGRFIATPDRFRNAFAPRQVQFGLRVSF